MNSHGKVAGHYNLRQCVFQIRLQQQFLFVDSTDGLLFHRSIAKWTALLHCSISHSSGNSSEQSSVALIAPLSFPVLSANRRLVTSLTAYIQRPIYWWYWTKQYQPTDGRYSCSILVCYNIFELCGCHGRHTTSSSTTNSCQQWFRRPLAFLLLSFLIRRNS